MGGIPAVLKYLLENGLIHGDCLTVTGKTIAKISTKFKGLSEGQQVIKPLDCPIKVSGHLHYMGI